MDFKKLFIPTILLLLLATASAAITTTVVDPSAGKQFLPNTTEGVPFIDVNFTVVDSGEKSDYNATITFEGPDGNVFLMTDTNLDSGNCTFATIDVWTTPGASCEVRYTFPTGGNSLPTQGYILDFNVTSYVASENSEEGLAIVLFSIDNRYIATSVEALLLILPIVLIAALLVIVVLAMAQILTPKTVMMVAIGAVISVIAVVVMVAMIQILTP